MRRITLSSFAFFLLLSAWVGATAFSGAARAEQEAVHPARQDADTTAPASESATHSESGLAEEPRKFNEAEGVTAPEHEGAHGEAMHGEGAHGAAHEEEDATQEAIHAAEHVSFVDLILKALGYEAPHEGEKEELTSLGAWIHVFQMPIISLVVIGLLAFGAMAGTRKREMIPGRAQNLVEMLVAALDDFVEGVLGMEGRPFVPFIGTLFLYIWVSNMIGIIPFFKAPTSQFNTTVALAICVFLYVQYTGIRRNGIGGYLFHLAGEPRDGLSWGLVPLLFPLHVIGELAKPMSLSLRLFGNIFGEETLIAVFVGLGVVCLAGLHSPVGLPLHVPFLFLALLTSLIQAVVFALLSTIYFALMLPHHEHEGEHH